MANWGQKVYPSDYAEIKALLKAEVGRRGKTEGTARGQSVGSMASYNGSAYDFSTQPTAGAYIKRTYPKNYKAAGCDQRNIDHTRKWGANHSEQAEPSGSSAKRAELDPGNCCIKRVLWPLLWPVFHGMQYGLHELHRLLHGELHWILCGIVRQ